MVFFIAHCSSSSSTNFMSFRNAVNNSRQSVGLIDVNGIYNLRWYRVSSRLSMCIMFAPFPSRIIHVPVFSFRRSRVLSPGLFPGCHFRGFSTMFHIFAFSARVVNRTVFTLSLPILKHCCCPHKLHPRRVFDSRLPPVQVAFMPRFPPAVAATYTGVLRGSTTVAPYTGPSYLTAKIPAVSQVGTTAPCAGREM